MTSPTPPPPGTPGGCNPFDLGCLSGTAISTVATDALNALGAAIVTGVGNTIKSLSTLWIGIGTPDLAGGGVGGWLRGELAWFTGALAVLSLFIGGAKIVWERRREASRDVGRALFTLVAVNSMGVAIIVAAVAGGDLFATSIIDRSTQGTDFGANMATMLGVAVLSGLGIILVILLGLVALFASLVQIVLMVARGALLVLMTGVLPLASAATNTAAGRAWHQKIVGWTIAAILYKPAAAIVYATAFRMAGANAGSPGGLVTVLTGVLMMIMALLALPALMRLAVPLVTAVTSGGGGSRGGGGAVVGGLVATGGTVVAMRQSASRAPTGAAGTAGASGASGAAGAAGPAGAAVAAGIEGAKAVGRGVRRAADPGGEP